MLLEPGPTVPQQKEAPSATMQAFLQKAKEADADNAAFLKSWAAYHSAVVLATDSRSPLPEVKAGEYIFPYMSSPFFRYY